jgi:RNA polymerase subunit RPABC4/transcription elongation factor Spt4
MELETDEVSLRANSNGVDEIDLYDDLMAFSSLSPEEQKKESEPRVTNKSEHASQSASQFFYADLPASDEPILEPTTEMDDRSFELIEQSSFDLIGQPMSQPVEEPSANTNEGSPFELPDEPAFQEVRESSSRLIEAAEPRQKKSDYLDLNYLLRVTGPLVALGVTAAGSSLLACRDCGSPASGEDMFCVTCGGLLDQSEVSEAATAVAVKSACDDCGSLVEEGEIFCPSCGSVLEGL